MSLSDIGSAAPAARPAPPAIGRLRQTFAKDGPFRSLARSPSVTLRLPGGARVRLATDRVRARPALTPTLSGAIGLTAIGLGLAGTFFPRRIANLVGLPASRASIVTLFGLRELATGYALVSDPTRTPALWGRVAFDLVDMAVLKGAADDHRNPKRDNAHAALTAVLAVAALDLVAAWRMSTVKRNCEGAGR